MDIRKLQRAVVDGLEDVKAQDIVVFNTEHLSPLFERVIIASGTSNRQTKALASGVRDAVRAAGFPVLATEGGENGEWIIVDCGAAVAHIMQPAIRDYYRLEEIWGGKPVRMKIGSDAPRGLVKATEDDDEDDAPMAPQRKAAAKKGTVGRANPETATARPARAAKTAPGPRAAAKEAAAKTAARKKAGPVKAAAAKKAVAGKTAARPTSRTSAKPSAKPSVKVAAGKTVARKTAASAAKVQLIVVKPIQRRAPVAKAAGGRPAPARKAAPARKSAPAKKAAPRR